MRSRSVATAGVLASVLILGACTGQGASSGTPAGSPAETSPGSEDPSAGTIEMIDMTFAVAAGKNEPILLARDLGIFEKHGLNVEFKTFSSGAEAGQTVISGQADMGHVGDFPVMRLAVESGYELVIVSDFESDSELYVGVASSDIQAAEDLRGKTVATIVGSVPQYLLAKYLEANGMSESDLTVQNMAAPDMPLALEQGAIDAFFVWEPFGLQSLELSGDEVHTLTTGRDLMNGHLVLTSSRSFLDQNPEAVRRFLAALQEAIDYTNDNPDEAAQAFTDEYGTELELSHYNIERETFSLAVDDRFVEDFESAAEFLTNAGLLEEELDWSRLADFGPLQELDADLVSADFP